MPVIRGQATVSVLTAERRAELVQQLKDELAGHHVGEGPVIFEIPLDRSNKLDAVVVWKAFDSVSSDDRSGIISEAYGDDAAKISLALGVTYEEAIEQQVLPYAVVPMARDGEAGPDDVRRAMLEEGAFEPRRGWIDLRFPTMAMAEQAHGRLCDRLPAGHWSIAQSPVPTS